MNHGFHDARPARLKRVLVLHDLRAEADNAAWRAGLLARAHDGWMRVLNLSRFGHPEAARTQLAPLVWRLQEHLQVAVLAQALRGSFSGELRRAAEEADLVVTSAPGGLDAATGMHPLRLLRLAQRPTLVVRTPATTPYRRVLVGSDAERGVEQGVIAATAMGDGKEVPAVASPQSAAALLERERALFPDLVVLPCTRETAFARRFLVLTRTDTLLLPLAEAPARSGAARGRVGLAPQVSPARGAAA